MSSGDGRVGGNSVALVAASSNLCSCPNLEPEQLRKAPLLRFLLNGFSFAVWANIFPVLPLREFRCKSLNSTAKAPVILVDRPEARTPEVQITHCAGPPLCLVDGGVALGTN
jgi:hypothetical protein